MDVRTLIGRSPQFEQGLERSRNGLYRLAYAWSRNAAIADDVVQETLSKALCKSSQLRDLESLHSWLISILANCWRDHFRGNRETEDVDDIDERHLMNETTPEHDCQRSQIVQRVRKVVAELPAGQRQVLTLVDLEDCSYAEVASILKIPIGTVMSRLSRARLALKESLIDARAASAAPLLRRVK